jgi:hypothetical protein
MLQLQPVVTALPTIVVATVYCLWHVADVLRKQKDRRLRERVAYLLWVMANEIP